MPNAEERLAGAVGDGGHEFVVAQAHVVGRALRLEHAHALARLHVPYSHRFVLAARELHGRVLSDLVQE